MKTTRTGARAAIVAVLLLGSLTLTAAPAGATFGHHAGSTGTCEAYGGSWHTLATFKRSWFGSWVRLRGDSANRLHGTSTVADFFAGTGATHAVIKTGTRSALVDLFGDLHEGTITSRALRNRWSWHPTMDTVHLCDDGDDGSTTTTAPPTTAPPTTEAPSTTTAPPTTAPAPDPSEDCRAIADADGLVAKYEVVGGAFVYEKPAGNDGVVILTSATLDGGTWTSTVPVGAVVVKGGTESTHTQITPPSTSGTFSNEGLRNGGANVPDISNVQFFCAEPGSVPTPTTAPPTTEAPTTTAAPTTTVAPPTTAAPTTTVPPTGDVHQGCQLFGGWFGGWYGGWSGSWF